MIPAAALALVSSAPVKAQTPQPPDASILDGLTGDADVGARVEGTTGDEARYERYRDLRSGVFSRVTFGKDTDHAMFGALAEHVGYRDQRYLVNYNGGRSVINASWDSIPLNYSYLTSSPWVETSTGVFSLDTAARLAVQNKVPGVVGVPQTAAQLQTASIFRGLATPFDLQSRRDTAAFAMAYNATADVGVNVSISTTGKGGNQPSGMSFSFNNANELPMPIDNRTNDVSAGIEWIKPKGMLRFGWDGSWFDNQIHEIVWDNPLSATNTTPFDPSGYSNGNGPAQGRMSVPPSNNMHVFSATALYKMPSHTTLNGTFSFTAMNQDDALIPWTINSAIANPTVYQSFPGLASLPRATAEASVHGLNAMVDFTSRPNQVFGLSVRYRLNDHRNLTPIFDGTQYVRFDAAPEATGGPTEQFDIRENTLDATGTFNLLPYTAFRVGYTLDDFNRTGRSFNDTRENTVHASVDTVGNQYVTLRATIEHGSRVGSGFSESSLEDGGYQPGLRFYDEADRDRNRGVLLFTVTPAASVDLTFQFAKGRDIYNGPGHEFGLLNNDNTSYNVGVGYAPIKQIAIGANAGTEKFSSLQSSRNANPPGSDYGSWFDPNRTWNLDNDEKMNSVNLYLDVLRAIHGTDIHISYDYSDSDNAFVHSGPRVLELLTNTALTPGDTKPCPAGVNSCFLPLPNVTNTWQRFTADVKYFFTAKVGLGVAYWFEKFDVTDYSTIDLPGQAGTPRIDYLGTLNMGYGNRPYRGSTGFLRLLYLF
jgi:MtrB/PioB family decaheme-associated outer membrane protein